MKDKQVIVTGGAGFIGSHLVEHLVDAGYRVTVIDDLSRGDLKFLAPVATKIKFIRRDLREQRGLKSIFQGHNIVFNLAALNTGIDYDQGRTQVMFENNMLLQMIPLRIAAQTSSIKKFIQISSASVYSREAMENQVPTLESADTSDPEPSKLGYALAKKMGENLASWYAVNSELQVVTARFINVFGENDHFDDLGHFIPMMIRKVLLADKELVVFGDGGQKRSFIYVVDIVMALMTLLSKGESGQVYNVDAQVEYSVDEVTTMIANLTGRAKELNIIHDLDKPAGSRRRMLDTSKLKQLGWQPQFSFAQGLERTVADIKKRLG